MRYKFICLSLGVISNAACSGSIEVGPAENAASAGSSAGSRVNDTKTPSATASASDLAALGSTCTDSTPLPTWPTTSDCTSSDDLPIVGTYHGYIENQAAPWDDLKLVIRGASVAGGLCGTLTVGSGPALPPVTDPNVGYPEPVTYAPPQHQVVPGFEMTLLSGSTDGTRVRFSINPAEPWKGWCGLQTSYGAGSSGSVCSCLPGEGGGEQDGVCRLVNKENVLDKVVNCGQFFQCLYIYGVCQCNKDGCTSSSMGIIDFDLRFAGGEAEGSATYAPQPRTHFIRVP